MQIRQGDVLVNQHYHMKEVGAETTAQQIVVAEGEKTGHAHVLETRSDAFPLNFRREGDTLYVKIPECGATLTHQEHGVATIEQGVHSFTVQKEYDEDEGVRYVMD